MRLADVENPMILPQIERTTSSTFTEIKNDFEDDFENPSYDVFGSVIAPNDEYLIFEDDIVHVENAYLYMEKYLNADRKTKK